MSVIYLLALMLSAHAEPPVAVRVHTAEGLDAADLAAQLLALDALQGCADVVGNATYIVERAELQRAAGEEAALRWLREPVNPPFATCLKTALAQTDLGESPYTAEVSFQFGALPTELLIGATGTVVRRLSVEDVAAGLVVTVSRATGAEQSAIEALLESSRMELAACGGLRDGKVTLNGTWAKKLAVARLLSHSSGMEEVGACVEGVLQALPVLPLAESPRKGLSFQVVFRFPG